MPSLRIPLLLLTLLGLCFHRAPAQDAAAAAFPGAFVSRISGDEFGILLEGRPGDRVEGGHPAIAELANGAQRLLSEGTDDPLSVSCGVAMAAPDMATPSQLLAAADAAQYLAKRRGGNRVCTAAQVAAESEGEWVPIPDGGFRPRFWETAEEIARTLDSELAEAMDAPLGTVKSWVRRASAALKETLTR